MEWTDDGIILGGKRHGENSVILEVLTRQHGRHLGLVLGGRSARLSSVLQPGNGAVVTWRARLDEHLGQFRVEATHLRAGHLIDAAASLYGLSHLAGLIRLLPERDPYERLYDALQVVIEHLDAPRIAAPLIVRFELALLAELGFGIDLSACAVTGATQELVYVSPRSGRAVSARAGADYADRLLPLPAFARDGFLGDSITPAQLEQGFTLTGHFLARHVYGPRGIETPPERARFITASFKTGN
ncbi:MAG: DNA repair protein RecO [Hyphomicrobiales bacterium]|jgi:DNA repair protein RecO (recombination protein O)|nr:DNA repair protein RecO [Hyphomicrobiales bacterium]